MHDILHARVENIASQRAHVKSMLSYERALASKYSHVRHTLIRRTLVHRTLVRRTLVRRTLVRGHDMLALPSLDGCMESFSFLDTEDASIDASRASHFWIQQMKAGLMGGRRLHLPLISSLKDNSDGGGAGLGSGGDEEEEEDGGGGGDLW